MTTLGPIYVLKRDKSIAHADGSIEFPTHPDGTPQTEWAIHNHRCRSNGQVDYKATAQALADRLGETKEELGDYIQQGDLLRSALDETHKRIQAQRNRIVIDDQLLTAIRRSWCFFLLPHSIRAAITERVG